MLVILLKIISEPWQGRHLLLLLRMKINKLFLSSVKSFAVIFLNRVTSSTQSHCIISMRKNIHNLCRFLFTSKKKPWVMIRYINKIKNQYSISFNGRRNIDWMSKEYLYLKHKLDQSLYECLTLRWDWQKYTISFNITQMPEGMGIKDLSFIKIKITT